MTFLTPMDTTASTDAARSDKLRGFGRAQGFYFCGAGGGSGNDDPFSDARTSREVRSSAVPMDETYSDTPFGCVPTLQPSSRATVNSVSRRRNQSPQSSSTMGCWTLDRKRKHSFASNKSIDFKGYQTKFSRRDEKTASTCASSVTSISSIKSSQSVRFESILDQPLSFWGELNSVLALNFPTWSAMQRGRMIHHLVHFLELKVGLDEYVPTGLLMPTQVLDEVWGAVVLETSLYEKMTHAIQDFHCKQHSLIHYTRLQRRRLSPTKVEDMIRRTQSLFQVYFKEVMPCSIEEVEFCKPTVVVTNPPARRVSPTEDLLKLPPRSHANSLSHTGIPRTSSLPSPKRGTHSPIFEFCGDLNSLSKGATRSLADTDDETLSFLSRNSENLMGLDLVE